MSELLTKLLAKPIGPSVSRGPSKANLTRQIEVKGDSAEVILAEEDADDRQRDDSPGYSPAARRATPDVQRACWRATKYPGKGVLHDLARRDAGLRRT